MTVSIETSDYMLTIDYNEHLPLFVVHQWNENRWMLVYSRELLEVVDQVAYLNLMISRPHAAAWWLIGVWARMPTIANVSRSYRENSSEFESRRREAIGRAAKSNPVYSRSLSSFSFCSKEVRDDG